MNSCVIMELWHQKIVFIKYMYKILGRFSAFWQPAAPKTVGVGAPSGLHLQTTRGGNGHLSRKPI
jgi:hypothetical protein